MTQWVCPSNAVAPKLPPRKNERALFLRALQAESPSKSHLTRLLSLAGHALLTTSLAHLIGTDPFPLDRPGAEALVVRVVASEMAVLNKTTT
jgi:hypothetical protein